jgi:hypothetical protein
MEKPVVTAREEVSDVDPVPGQDSLRFYVRGLYALGSKRAGEK